MIKEENKVFQKLSGNGKNGTPYGDCMKCVMATLFGLKYEDVPHFVEHEDWHERYRKFLLTQGYEWSREATNSLPFGYHGNYYDMQAAIKNEEGVNGLFYASVYSPKFYNRMDDRPTTHAVLIDKEFNILFDPGPDYQDIEKYPEADIIKFNGVLHVDILKKIKL